MIPQDEAKMQVRTGRLWELKRKYHRRPFDLVDYYKAESQRRLDKWARLMMACMRLSRENRDLRIRLAYWRKQAGVHL